MPTGTAPCPQPGFLVLAAGRSQRFGDADKLLSPLDGKPLIAHTLDTLQQVVMHADEIVVCISPTATALADYLCARQQPYLICPRADEGMGSTLADAIIQLAHWSGWIVCLGDMPWIRATTFTSLRDHVTPHGLLAPAWQGQRGHPVRFDRRWGDSLQQLRGDTGARHLISQHHDHLALLSVDDPGITLDIDTPSDLNRRLDL